MKCLAIVLGLFDGFRKLRLFVLPAVEGIE